MDTTENHNNEYKKTCNGKHGFIEGSEKFSWGDLPQRVGKWFKISIMMNQEHQKGLIETQKKIKQDIVTKNKILDKIVKNFKVRQKQIKMLIITTKKL